LDDAFPDALVQRARNGDVPALNTLLTRYTDRAYAICRRILGHPEDARDATQEALINVARNIGSFDGGAAFTTWAYRITTNAALDELRRRKRRPEPAEVLERTGRNDTDAVADRIDIDAAMLQVNEEFRVAVVLRDVIGLDYQEIAVTLDVPIGTVRSRIARGRAQLAEILGNSSRNPNVKESDG
jgi:RNA polymerase sigma-70 factor (ECF subfamily)